MSDHSQASPAVRPVHEGNLLGDAVRRDIADLNRLFLDRALDPLHGADQWFQLPAAATERLVAAPADARERAALCPVTLFELRLPQFHDDSTWRLDAVTDGDLEPVDHATGESRRSFGLVALGVARRLAEGVPLSSRIAFGLRPACESRLSRLSPCDSFRIAGWPGLVRPRWPGNARYWSLLATAALDARGGVLHWAYAAGLCLLNHEARAAAQRTSPRRPAHGRHRRGPASGSDVPC
jgi:hypothetical protein